MDVIDSVLVSADEEKSECDYEILDWAYPDKRSGQVILLVQCAAGGNWKPKTRNVVLRKWVEQLFDFAQLPVTAFALPIVCEKPQWLDLSKEAGILMDRARVTLGLRTRILPREIITGATKWCKSEIKTLSWLV